MWPGGLASYFSGPDPLLINLTLACVLGMILPTVFIICRSLVISMFVRTTYLVVDLRKEKSARIRKIFSGNI